jgi:hypothetical protein
METDGVTSTVEFTCDSGYSIKGDTSVQCGSDGVWLSTFPECGKLGDMNMFHMQTHSLSKPTPFQNLVDPACKR